MCFDFYVGGTTHREKDLKLIWKKKNILKIFPAQSFLPSIVFKAYRPQEDWRCGKAPNFNIISCDHSLDKFGLYFNNLCDPSFWRTFLSPRALVPLLYGQMGTGHK